MSPVALLTVRVTLRATYRFFRADQTDFEVIFIGRDLRACEVRKSCTCGRVVLLKICIISGVLCRSSRQRQFPEPCHVDNVSGHGCGGRISPRFRKDHLAVLGGLYKPSSASSISPTFSTVRACPARAFQPRRVQRRTPCPEGQSAFKNLSRSFARLFQQCPDRVYQISVHLSSSAGFAPVLRRPGRISRTPTASSVAPEGVQFVILPVPTYSAGSSCRTQVGAVPPVREDWTPISAMTGGEGDHK